MAYLPRALPWLVALLAISSNAQEWPSCQDVAQYQQGGCCLLAPEFKDLPCPFPGDHDLLFPRQEQKACTTDYDCSGPECAGAMHYGACENNVCVCKAPGPPPATCSAPEECSLPDCTGDGKTVACEDGTCVCKDQGATPPACSAPEECSLPDCTGDGKTVACEGGACVCKTNDSSPACTAPEQCSLPDCTGDGKTVACEGGSCVCKTSDSSPACTKPEECSLPDCTGDGKSVACEEGACVCKTTTAPPATCSAPEQCSLPDCTGDGKTVACEQGACVCKTEGQTTPPTCSTPEECSLPDCTGDDKSVACENGSCVCKTADQPGASTCTGPEQCSLPDCTGDDKIVACESGSCICKDKAATPPNCSAPEECSLPDCTGDGKTVTCENGQCVCKTGSQEEPPACSAPEQCSIPDCTGDGKTVACEEGKCTCKDQAATPPSCSAPEECSLPDCTGEGKTVACEDGKCECQTQGEGSPEVPPTPTFAPTQITQEGGAVVTVVIIQGGPITAPITLSSVPEPTIDVSADDFKSRVESISSKVVSDILASATAWADAPDAPKATTVVQSIEGLLPEIGEIAAGLPNGQKVFDCPELANTPTKRQNADDVVSQLQKINCELLKLLGLLQQGQTSTDPAVLGPAQEQVHTIVDQIKPDLQTLGETLGIAPPQTCNAETDCNLPECTGDGKTVSCQEGKCKCEEDNETNPQTCSANEECASLSDCEGDGKEKVCQDGKCTCKDKIQTPSTCSNDGECESIPDCDGDNKKKVCEDGKCACKTDDADGAVTATITALPPGASLQTLTNTDITDNMVTTTTSEGSSDPTIVPIIIPFGGKPPVICWGCIPLPANVQIKVPEFCVKILGMKIGKCPSDDNPEHEDPEHEDPEHEDPEHEDPEHEDPGHEDPEHEDPEEEEDPCVLTVTCTQGCVIESQTDPAAPVKTLTCESKSESIPCETPEPTQCEPTSTTTTTTTTTATALVGICDDSDSCGGASCGPSKRQVLDEERPLREDLLAKRAEPPVFDSPILVEDFEEYDRLTGNDRSGWFVYARQLIDEFSAGNGYAGNVKIPTSKMWDIQNLDRPFITGAGPSWGCTTVMVYSNLGIYLAHFWEGAQMIADFEGSKDFLRNGNPGQGFPGFTEAAQRYFGNGASFVQALVFTPRYNQDRYQNDGSILTPRPGSGKSDTNPWYKAEVDEFIGIIVGIAPKARGVPLIYDLAPDLQASVGQFGQQERSLAVLQYTPRRVLGMGNLQSDNCEVFRAIRVIHPLGQVYGPTSWRAPAANNQKRDGESCSLGPAEEPAGGEELYDENGNPLDPNSIGTGGGGGDEPKTCSATEECSGEKCEGEDETSSCEDGVCKCKKPDTSTPGSKTCSSDDECSGPDCAGGMHTSACEDGVCVCKTPPLPPPKKSCTNDAECSSPDCSGGMRSSKCEEGVCVCKIPDDPSVCSTADTCTYLQCKDSEDRACTDGHCECKEKTCSNTDDCGFLSCQDNEEKACEDSKCTCKTKPEEPPAPSYVSGTCNTHIREAGNNDGFTTQIKVYDGAGNEIASYDEVNTKHNWGDIITIPKDKLPHEMKYEFLKEWLGRSNKRDRPPPGTWGKPDPLLFTTYSVRITAGGTTWSTEDDKDSSKIPRCEVGKWDTHGTWDPNTIITDFLTGNNQAPTRDMDCRWAC